MLRKPGKDPQLRGPVLRHHQHRAADVRAQELLDAGREAHAGQGHGILPFPHRLRPGLTLNTTILDNSKNTLP